MVTNRNEQHGWSTLFKRKKDDIPCKDLNVEWLWNARKCLFVTLQPNKMLWLKSQFSCCEGKKKWHTYKNTLQCAQLWRPAQAHAQEVMTDSSCQKTHLLTGSSENDNNLGLSFKFQVVPQNDNHRTDHWKQPWTAFLRRIIKKGFHKNLIEHHDVLSRWPQNMILIRLMPLPSASNVWSFNRMPEALGDHHGECWMGSFCLHTIS